MKRVIQRYTDLTGKTAMAPMQSLGYLGSTMFYCELEEKCDDAILDFIGKCKKYGVPISNFHLSSGYTFS
jgi:alpha-glucosidase